MAQAQFLEDFIVGDSGWFGSYEVTRDEVIEFATKYDPQPFHLSEEAGKAMHFGGLCASGWHTCAMVMRMTVDHMVEGNGSLGSPGIDELRWIKPVFPGDTLRIKSTVLDVRPSKSRPNMGIVNLHNEVYNQNDDVVMSFKPIVMYARKPAD